MVEATEEPRRSPSGQRSQTRSFVYLAWPALVVLGLTLVLVEGHRYFDLFVRLGVVLAVGACGAIALVYAVLATMANAPTKVRMLACAANVSVVVLALLVVPGYRSLLAGGQTLIAETQCKTLHDKAMMWKRIKGKPPSSIEEMVAPLKDGDDENFLDSVPDDPWGHPYVLNREGTKIRVYSWGEDGKEGTDDDIVYPAE